MDLIEARNLALDTLREHGLTDWHVGFDRAVKRFGCCNYRYRRIQLSEKLTRLNDEATVSDVIRHEVAHALAGVGAGHGPRWRAMCAVTGAKPERCYRPEDVVAPPAPWYLVCPAEGCTVRVARQRRTEVRGERRCRRHNVAVIWERGGATVAA